MNAKISCQNCNMKNSLHLERCQYCGQTLEQPQHGSDADFQNLISNTDNSEAPSAHREFTMVDLVNAQNRTTYAIRSLAIFFFTTLCTSLIGYGLVGAGTNASLKCDSYYSDCGSSALIIGGWVIIVIGFLVGVLSGANELGKSKP